MGVGEDSGLRTDPRLRSRRIARIATESIFIAPDGNTEIKKAVDYVYSLNETEAMLNKSGLAVKEIWSIPGKKRFTMGEPRVYIVAEKITS